MSMDEIVVRDRHIEVLEARIAELESEIKTQSVRAMHNAQQDAAADETQAGRIKGLEEALIEERAQYLRTLDDNPGCSAWDFDDLTTVLQEEYKNDARKLLHSEGKI